MQAFIFSCLYLFVSVLTLVLVAIFKALSSPLYADDDLAGGYTIKSLSENTVSIYKLSPLCVDNSWARSGIFLFKICIYAKVA